LKADMDRKIPNTGLLIFPGYCSPSFPFCVSLSPPSGGEIRRIEIYAASFASAMEHCSHDRINRRGIQPLHSDKKKRNPPVKQGKSIGYRFGAVRPRQEAFQQEKIVKAQAGYLEIGCPI